jgi:hypothetical protein
MVGTMSLCSSIRLRANRNICASQCTDHECYKGTEELAGCPMFHHALFVDNSHHCKLCMECLRTCPHGSVRVYVQAPVKGLWTEGRISPLTAAFSVTLAGAALILALSRWTGLPGLPDLGLRTTLEFSLATVAVLSLGLFTLTVFTRIAREPRALETYPWVRLCLTFAPLGWAVLLCYHLGTSALLHNTIVAIGQVPNPLQEASLLGILYAGVIVLGAAMTAVTFWQMYVGHFRLAPGTSRLAWAVCVVAAIAYGVVGFGSYWRGAGPV